VAELNGTVHSAEMAAGEKSQFDVIADGELVFSKQSAGRFPEHVEILKALT
jgi:predicted Rdx family selenoprotein